MWHLLPPEHISWPLQRVMGGCVSVPGNAALGEGGHVDTTISNCAVLLCRQALKPTITTTPSVPQEKPHTQPHQGKRTTPHTETRRQRTPACCTRSYTLQTCRGAGVGRQVDCVRMRHHQPPSPADTQQRHLCATCSAGAAAATQPPTPCLDKVHNMRKRHHKSCCCGECV